MEKFLAKFLLPLILTVIVMLLVYKGRKRDLQKQNGLSLMFAGFSLIVLGSFFEVSEYVSLRAEFWRNFSD